jgi:glycosyltransferase involved in cell wall biosynthesis
MKILFLSSWFPYPPDNGARIRVYNLIRHLAARHRITLLSFVHDGQTTRDVKELASLCETIEVVPAREFRRTSLKALAGFVLSRPRWLVDVHSAEMERLVRRAQSAAATGPGYDVVIASGIKMAPYLSLLDDTPRVLEEIETTILLDELAHPAGRIQHLRAHLRWTKFSRYIRSLLRENVDGCTVVSAPERANLARIVPDFRPIAVVPNGVDMAYYRGFFGQPVPDTLIFNGALTYSANYDAIAYFLEKIWPRVRAQRPQARMAITGRTRGVALDRLPPDDGVIYTGYLPDIRPCVAQSRVCVVPLRIGGGTRLKILEAMALGTPVISTSKGAEGLDVTDGKDILLADTPGAFADGVIRLLTDDALCARLAENGRRLVESRYDWASIGQEMEQLIRDVVKKARSA